MCDPFIIDYIVNSCFGSNKSNSKLSISDLSHSMGAHYNKGTKDYLAHALPSGVRLHRK